ncbi:helix-turn-helix transcriptional regulator [Cryptosporangium phraense]|uniref:AAA family ATPase n=1 Tax=Cryptosporangium phraense TaxID=2593070 RepID=A0A545AY00_9ACTN|nr:LuxR family transcriptional regulator [Cryptosporangium phraense]TQS46213.1 AAA family ATPase [Cryptosporangium phraense]
MAIRPKAAETVDVLVGRTDECRVLDELVDAVRDGRGRATVLRGEPGIGKSALLHYLGERADDLQLLRATGTEAEAELPFAGLHQMLGSMVALIDDLPVPQRNALRVAFGVEPGGPPDRYAVGLGVLNLLNRLAVERPVLCLVDDEQWLDRSTVLALSFVARRSTTAAVGFVFASRRDALELQGLPTLTVPALSDRHARVLLDSVLAGPLDPSVRDQIVSETRGNPLALLELPRGVGPAALAGGFRFPGVMPLPQGIELGYQRSLEALPETSRQFLLLAATDPVGDPTTLWSAASRLGLGPEAATPAVASGLVTVGARVEFSHPLARTAVYRSADLVERRVVHEALAAVTDPGSDPDRRAWHRAHAVAGPDDEAADDLERSADRARSRGGLAAAAAFLEQAATLTTDTGDRIRRLIAAAEAMRDSGSLDSALVLLETAGLRSLADEHAARIMRIRGLIMLEQHRHVEAVELLLGAATRFGERNPVEATETMLEVLLAAIWDAQPADLPSDRVLEAVAATLRRSSDPPTLTELLLHGLHVRINEGFVAAAPLLRRGVDALVAAAPSDRWSGFGAFRLMLMLPEELCDEEAWGALVLRQVAACRRDGALGVLPSALSFASFYRIYEGDFFAAESMIDEANARAVMTPGRSNRHSEVIVSAWRGDEFVTRKLTGEMRRLIAAGRGAHGLCADYADAVLANGLGQFDVALDAAKRVFVADQLPLGSAVATELMDAASRAGALEELRAVGNWLAERVAVLPSSWLTGLHERSLALLTDDDAAESHYVASIEALSRTRGRLEVARAQLLFGEWLRRRGRRGDARRHLREAHRGFEALGAQGFARRAARELQATGDATVRITERRPAALTAQEAQIAALAGDGLTNPEIGARLFISRRTVQYHLRKVFMKLGITSRAQLPQALPGRGAGDASEPGAASAS